LRDLLARALAAPEDHESLQVSVDCREGSRLRSLQVFGNGVAIHDERTQFHVSPPQIAAILRAILEARFPELEESYGEAEHDAVTMMICRVEVAIDGTRKQVVQLAEGGQSAELARLAHDLLALCEPTAHTGVGASTLRDGLEKLARGELAPESWTVSLQRRAEAAGEDDDRPGFRLSISASEATSRDWAGADSGEPRALALGPQEVRALAAELAARDPAAWPVNLWASDYVDLSVRVLNHEKSVQARQFAGLNPAAHSAARRQLEEVLGLLEQLHRRVREQGRPVGYDEPGR
jgi:hypothetical protein